MRLFLGLVFSCWMLLAGGAPLYKGKFLSFPAAGTLNPKEGTIEITYFINF